MNLHSIEAFLAVAETSSFTLAGKRLEKTQSAVSQAIRQLEEELGVILIDRASRQVTLTPSGDLMRRLATRLAEDIKKMTSLVREQSMTKVSQLRIGMVDSFSSAVGPSLISSMMSEAVNLNLSSDVTPRLGEALLAKRLDIVFANDSYDSEPQLTRYELLREPFVLLLPKDVRWDEETPDLASLARAYPMVRYATQSHIASQIDAQCHRLNVTPSRRVTVDTTEKLMASVAAGVGWSIGNPLSLLMSGRQRRLIRIAPFPGETFYRRLCVVARRGEFDDLVLRLARLSSAALSELVEGELHDTYPELYSQIRVAQFDEVSAP